MPIHVLNLLAHADPRLVTPQTLDAIQASATPIRDVCSEFISSKGVPVPYDANILYRLTDPLDGLAAAASLLPPTPWAPDNEVARRAATNFRRSVQSQTTTFKSSVNSLSTTMRTLRASSEALTKQIDAAISEIDTRIADAITNRDSEAQTALNELRTVIADARTEF